MEPEAKEVLHQQWLEDEVRVMVATSAFGQGLPSLSSDTLAPTLPLPRTLTLTLRHAPRPHP